MFKTFIFVIFFMPLFTFASDIFVQEDVSSDQIKEVYVADNDGFYTLNMTVSLLQDCSELGLPKLLMVNGGKTELEFKLLMDVEAACYQNETTKTFRLYTLTSVPTTFKINGSNYPVTIK